MRDALVCSIGSTDPTGGAGLFADALAYTRLGVRAAYVVAGVTAQNSISVDLVASLPARVISAQLESVWAQCRPSAIRIGLLPDASAIDAVAKFLRRTRGLPPVVLDPVLSSTSGRIFAGPEEIMALRRLMRLATIVTPNAHEAEALAGIPVRDATGAGQAALSLSECGAAILVKGGHIRGASIVDTLAMDGHLTRFRNDRLARDMRGTGCALAAALAASLGSGVDLVGSVRRARAFVRRVIASSRRMGTGRPQITPARAAGVSPHRA